MNNEDYDTAATAAEYRALNDQLDTAIEALARRLDEDDLQNPEAERVRLKAYRTLGYLVRTKRQVMQDRTLVELDRELEELREEFDAHEELTIGARKEQ